eukprot:6464970-Amphidinium_carterae.1
MAQSQVCLKEYTLCAATITAQTPFCRTLRTEPPKRMALRMLVRTHCGLDELSDSFDWEGNQFHSMQLFQNP